MNDTPRDARWSEAEHELPSELSELLRAGRDALGSPEEVSELGRRLSAVLGPAAGLTGGESTGGQSGAAHPGASRAAQAPRSISASLPTSRAPALVAPSRIGLFAGVGAGVAVGVAAFMLWHGPSASVGTPTPPAVLVPGSREEAAPSAPPEPSVPAPAQPSAAPPAAPDDAAQAAAGEAAHRSPLRDPAPHAPARSTAARHARAGESETALLEQARAALQSRPAAALELTRRHQARFPHGALAQEREVIAIEALERLGRKAAADARAAEFERHYRGSVHQPRLMRGSDTSAPAGAGSNTTVP